MGATIGAAILSAIPWQGIFGIVIKIVFMVFDKNQKYAEAKKLMLKFIDEVDKHQPVKIRKTYESDLKEIREELRLEAINKENLIKEKETYKQAYLCYWNGED